MSPSPALVVAALAAGLILGSSRVSPAQAVAGAPAQDLSVRLGGLADQMAEEVNQLAAEVARSYGQVPARGPLVDDARELAEAVGEYRKTLAAPATVYQLQQAYAGLDVSWNHLRARLAPLAGRSAVADATVARIRSLDDQARQLLGVNPAPPGFYTGDRTAPGTLDVRRLANALVSRARQLAATIPVAMANDPNAPELAQVAVDLAVEADRFHDALDAKQPAEVVREAYLPVFTRLDRLSRPLATAPLPVRQVWRGIAAVDAQIQKAFGDPAVPPAPSPNPAAPELGGEPPTVPGLTDRLRGQVAAFLRGFTPLANDNPANLAILADAQRLRDEADDFRVSVVAGEDTERLAYEYRDVDASWIRLWRRIARAPGGRNAPFVEQARGLAATCAQIHQALGMPGYPPGYP